MKKQRSSGSNKPLVSIAMITYNNGKFIADAIESALAQDYPNIEIVISDDASTDSTIEIINKYAALYPSQIRVLAASKNMGATNNWFKCVSACKGKYVTGLAGDDRMYPEKVTKQVAIMESDPDITICYTDASVFHVSTNCELYRLSQKSPTRSGDLKIALADSLYYSPTVMFRRIFAPKANLFKNIRNASDLAYYKEVMILSGSKGKIHYLPDVLFIYNKHETNLTVISKNNHYREHIEAIRILQRTYPEYTGYLNASIVDFACVGLCKSIIAMNFRNAGYFLRYWLKAGKGNLWLMFRSMFWGLKFAIRAKLCCEKAIKKP